MASIFGHAMSAYAIGHSYPDKLANLKFWTLGVCCSILPDADVLSFSLGIPYGSFWGHRGFTHSFLFALITGLLFAFIFFREKITLKRRAGYILFFFLCTASHGVLDAMTNGGKGVAFFSPWDNSRYFFPWRPIQVSPIGIDSFFSEWGIRVITSELLWIGLPCLIYIVSARVLKQFWRRKKKIN